MRILFSSTARLQPSFVSPAEPSDGHVFRCRDPYRRVTLPYILACFARTFHRENENDASLRRESRHIAQRGEARRGNSSFDDLRHGETSGYRFVYEMEEKNNERWSKFHG